MSEDEEAALREHFSRDVGTAPAGVCPLTWLPMRPPRPDRRDAVYRGLLASEAAEDITPIAMRERQIVRSWMAQLDRQQADPSKLEQVVAAHLAGGSEILRCMLLGKVRAKRGYEATRAWCWREARKLMRPHLARAVVWALDDRFGDAA